MKKTLCMITTFVMLVMCMFIPHMTADAANISLGVSASSIKIGDSVSVTVSVPQSVTGPVFVTFSNDILEFSKASINDISVSGGNINISIGKYGLAGTNKVTLTFKAKTSGSAKVSATHGDLYDDNTFKEVKLGSASATITVANKVTEQEGGGGNLEPQKSKDNSLSSLKLSSGTLSPSFKHNVTKYTATVGYDVTKVVVSAKTSNAKAVIESVTGDGTVNLKVGENIITVVVRAENGLKATYTIIVTRKGQEMVGEVPPSGSEGGSETDSPIVNEMLQWNGEQLQAVENIPAEKIPANFESTLLVVNGQQIPGLSFNKGDLKVLYLNNTNNAGSLYVYDEAQQTIYPFIKLTSEKSYVMILLPDEQNAPAPEGFERCTFSIEGKGLVSAYRLKEDSTMSWNLFSPERFYAAEPKVSDFYLIYAMNAEGEKGWYLYDSVEETYQRYMPEVLSIETGSIDGADLESKYLALQKELNTAKMVQYIIIAVAVVIILILFILVIVLGSGKKNRDEVSSEMNVEEENLEEVIAEEVIVKEAILEETNIEEMTAKETFDTATVTYAQEQELQAYDEDDDDLEFIDFD